MSHYPRLKDLREDNDLTQEKVAKLLKLSEKIEHVHDELIERYFLALDNYFNEGYQI